MQKRNVLSSPRLLELKRKRRQAVHNKLLIILVGLVILCALGAYFSKLDSLNVSIIQVSGNKVIDTDRIQETVNAELAGKYMWLFPKSNVLYYPTNAIKTDLQNKFPRLNNINLSVTDKETLTVLVTEREAKYLWCGPVRTTDIAPQGGNEKCYFLDDTGYIFDEAPYFSGEVYFKFYGGRDDMDGLHADNPVGSYFSKENFAQLISFKDVLTHMGLQPVILDIGGNGDVELFLARRGSSKTGPKIVFRADADLTHVAENLQAALSTEPLMSGFKKKYSLLQYIDLRFGNKVYFKFLPASLGQ